MEMKKTEINRLLKSKEISWFKKNKLRLSKNYKHLVFFGTSEKIFFDNKTLLKAVGVSKKYKINLRLNLHKSKNNEIHSMIMISRKGTTTDIHLHKKYYTTYHLIKGKVNFFFYNKKGDIFKKLSTNDRDKIIIKIPPNTFRSYKTLSEISVFHETREGPYKRSDIKRLK